SDTLFSVSNHPAPHEISILSLHDALPISAIAKPPTGRLCSRLPEAKGGDSRPGERSSVPLPGLHRFASGRRELRRPAPRSAGRRSEEHTSELQSLTNLVCRLLLEKKNTLT